jgi:hypothetical protein
MAHYIGVIISKHFKPVSSAYHATFFFSPSMSITGIFAAIAVNADFMDGRP